MINRLVFAKRAAAKAQLLRTANARFQVEICLMSSLAIFHFSRRSTCSKKPHKRARSTAYEGARFPRCAILLGMRSRDSIDCR
jgi:hypothetical protein